MRTGLQRAGVIHFRFQKQKLLSQPTTLRLGTNNMIRNMLFASSAMLLAMSAVPASATELLSNGNFESGLASWTSFHTANGTITESPSSPPSALADVQNAAVKSFNTNGSGNSNALYLNAGKYAGPYGSGTAEGGGVFQEFISGTGTATFSVDIAALSRYNMSGVLFSVLLDGAVLDSYSFDNLIAGAVSPNTLDFATDLTAGTHTLALEVTRLYAPSNIVAEYFDNASLNFTPAAVPESSTWAMMIVGFGAAGLMMRRKRNTYVSFA
jgi:hypothetical protein